MIAAPLTESRQCELLSTHERLANALIESADYQRYVAHCEYQQITELSDNYCMMDTEEAQKIHNEVLSPLAEFQAREWECAKCREGK